MAGFLNEIDSLPRDAERAWRRALAGYRYDDPAPPADCEFLRALAKGNPDYSPEFPDRKRNRSGGEPALSSGRNRKRRNGKAKDVRLRRPHSDLGTPERARRSPLVIEPVPAEPENGGNRSRARAVQVDDPLYVYRRNRVVSVTQRDAGLVLRELWNRTGRAPRIVAPYQEVVTRGSAEGVHVVSAEHHRRFVEAIRAVGPIGSDTLVSVVCLQEFVPRGHYEILRRGLDILAMRFGLTEAPGPTHPDTGAR